MRYSLERPAEVKLFVNEVMRGGDQLRDRWNPSKQAMLGAAERITEWIDKGLIRPVGPFLLQFNIWSLIEQNAVMGNKVRYMMGLGKDEPLDGERITKKITSLVMMGLRVVW